MIGSLIGLAFGLLWFLVGAMGVGRPAEPGLMAAGVAIFLLAAVWAAKRRPRPGGVFIRKYYIAAVIAEVIAIMVAQAWLVRHGRTDLIYPVVGIMVGLHFIGLWKAMGLARFLALAAAMVAINLIALLPGLTPSDRLMISGFGSSAALLLTVIL